MKAIIQNEFGDANVLSYAEVELPKIGDGEFTIKGQPSSWQHNSRMQKLE